MNDSSSMLRRVLRDATFQRALRGSIAIFVVVLVAVWLLFPLMAPDIRVRIRVRWKPGVTDARRAELERRFHLTEAEHTEGTTWAYHLVDSSTANIAAMVQHPDVDDTAHVNRIRYRPEFGMDRERQIPVYSVGAAIIASLAWFVWVFVRRAPQA